MIINKKEKSMAFKFTKNIKVGIPCSKGEIVFEFIRPENEVINGHIASLLDIKTDNTIARLKKQDEIRIALYNNCIAMVYIERPDGTIDEIVGENDEPMLPKDFPDRAKCQSVVAAFEMGGAIPKNI
jgi:hypothetical protein